MIKVLTDYPFVALGDTPGKMAPARVVDAVWYDGDKYVGLILPDGQRASIKAGYCYALNAKNGYRVNPAVFSLPECWSWEAYDEAALSA